MSVYFVDTNIILRFLTQDNNTSYLACRQLFKKAQEGKICLTTSPLVLFETIWTLLSFYKESKEEVVEKSLSFLSFSNLNVENKELFLEALLIWQQKNINFNDAFNYVWAKKSDVRAIYSYDKHFDQMSEVARLEP